MFSSVMTFTGEDYSGTLTVRGGAATVAAKGQASLRGFICNELAMNACMGNTTKHQTHLNTILANLGYASDALAALKVLQASRNVIINDLHRAASSMIHGLQSRKLTKAVS